MAWDTTVNELMYNFKGGVQAILPWMRKSRIAYAAPDAYDDWDDIVSALYKSMVLLPLTYASENSLHDERFVPYDVWPETYQGYNCIVVNYDRAANFINVFFSLEVVDEIELVNIVCVDKTTREIISNERVSYNDSSFSLLIEDGCVFDEVSVQ